MARTVLTPVVADDSGTITTPVVGTVDGHSVDNSGSDILLLLNNTGAVSRTVTIPTPKTIDDLAIPDRTIALAAAQRKVAGPFGSDLYNQTGADAGKLFINFEATQAEVNVVAVKWPGR